MKKRGSLVFFFALTSILFIELLAQSKVNLQEIYQLKISRTTNIIKVDGSLDEEVWKSSQVATDFWVSFPVDGVRASRELNTTVRITYDDEFIYVAAECIGPGPYIIQSLKRDIPLFWRETLLVWYLTQSTNEVMVLFSQLIPTVHEALITGQTGRRGNNGSSNGINRAWDNKWYSEVQILEDDGLLKWPFLLSH